MNPISQANWQFSFNNTSGLDKMKGVQRPPTQLAFPACIDLVKHLADDSVDDYIRIHQAVEDRLENDTDARAWKAVRTRLGTVPHFRKYRNVDCDLYHNAARARAAGRATPQQLALVSALEAEIAPSKTIVPAGQIVTHGRANRDLTTMAPYPAFLSTTLNPVVARNSAFRRAGMNQVNGQPVVYVLSITRPLPALWGQTGNSCEYELLFAPGLSWREVSSNTGSKFELIEAELV
ncbi:MAG: hypothetical protein ABL871_13145 [Terricaulis sp.]